MRLNGWVTSTPRYASAGVDQAAGDTAVAALVAALRRTKLDGPSRAVDLRGHYASVIRLDERTGLAMSTDTVGTKMVVAERLGRFDTIGIDCVAMNANDIVCVGAEPLAMLDFILCGETDTETFGALGEGLARGAELAGIEVTGGEVAQVGDIVNGHELGGTCVGTVPLKGIITGAAIEVGDPIIGLPSSGLHSNGYTLARSALADVPYDDDRLGRPLGDILLAPTEIYVRAVLLRLGDHVGYEIEDPLPVPPVFELIRELGGVSPEEMDEVFNMGCGFCAVVSAGSEDAALEILRARYPDARRIGRAVAAPGVVRA